MGRSGRTNGSGSGTYDSVIIGGGHNGLTCAAFLARAGKRVLVLEANPKVGGFIVTEPVPGAPGYAMNPYAIEFPFDLLRPSVSSDLNLPRYGLRWAAPDPHNTYLGPHGARWSVWRDIGRTCASIAKISPHDARQYERLMRPLVAVLDTAIPYLMDHPTRPAPRTLASLVRRVAKNRRELIPGARTLVSSPLEILERFESEEVKAFIAMNTSTGGFRPLEEVTNTSILMFFALLHLSHLQRPIGGSGAFSGALAACVEASGGEIRTSAPVGQVVVRNGKARGVTLENGETIAAESVIAAIDPTSLMTRLVEPSEVPPEVRADVGALQVHSSGIGHFKVDVALSRRPTFPKHALPEGYLGGLSIASSVERVQRIMASCARGEISSETQVFLAVPSVLDRSLVPPGSDGDVGFIWGGAVPAVLSEGRSWDDEKDRYRDQLIAHLDEYSPGFSDSIIGMHTAGPDEMNNAWVYRGSSRGVDLIPSQIGPWRPCPSLSGYRTPIEDLWHTGHGAHPMSGTNGWSGRTTARTILKAERRAQRRLRSPV